MRSYTEKTFSVATIVFCEQGLWCICSRIAKFLTYEITKDAVKNHSQSQKCTAHASNLQLLTPSVKELIETLLLL